MKMKLTDLKINKGKEGEQIRRIHYDLASLPAGPLGVTACEDSGTNRSSFLHNLNNISSLCYDVLHDSHCRWLDLRC